MTPDEFADFARDRLLVAFPGWGQWLKANSPNVPATIREYGRRYASITRDEADRIVDLIRSGRRESPPLHLLTEWVANYAERERQDRKRDQRQGEQRTSYQAARRSMQGKPGEWRCRDYLAVLRHYFAIAKQGGTERAPCYDTDHDASCWAWARDAARVAELHPGERGESEYREAVVAAGVDLELGKGPMVRQA